MSTIYCVLLSQKNKFLILAKVLLQAEVFRNISTQAEYLQYSAWCRKIAGTTKLIAMTGRNQGFSFRRQLCREKETEMIRPAEDTVRDGDEIISPSLRACLKIFFRQSKPPTFSKVRFTIWWFQLFFRHQAEYLLLVNYYNQSPPRILLMVRGMHVTKQLYKEPVAGGDYPGVQYKKVT